MGAGRNNTNVTWEPWEPGKTMQMLEFGSLGSREKPNKCCGFGSREKPCQFDVTWDFDKSWIFPFVVFPCSWGGLIGGWGGSFGGSFIAAKRLCSCS